MWAQLCWRCALLCMLTAVCGCARAGFRQDGNRDAVATKWHYRIKLTPRLERLEAELCFEGATPSELRAGKSEGAERLEYARWLRPGAIRRLPVERGRIQLGASSPNGCVGYAVNLSEGGSLGASIRRVGRDLLASPNVWLWRPERRAEHASATLQLELPEGIEALLPWPEQGGRRLLDAGAFRFDSYAAFGRFSRARGEHRGVQLELALLEGELAMDAQLALRWLSSAVDVLAQSGGGFPTTRVSAIVLPAGDQREPVPFGMVARGGQASLLLLVSSKATEQELRRDWVLPHELSHLLLPFIEREQAWLSEGLASYYQELLRARAGAQSEQTALLRLARSLHDAARARGEGSIVRDSARMHLTHAYRRVYWGGAAFWLAADVALRRDSHGHASLDSVLSALRAEGALSEVWTARALLEKLDALAGRRLFSLGYAEAERRAFPEYESTLEALGVRLSGGALELDDAAPLAELRRSLFAPVR